jgi:protein-S-isoprenylcysteine O-methyltransferase Ste14
MKARFERWRIRTSVLAGVTFLALMAVTSSQLEEDAPIVSALVFFVGLILVGIASVGRLWCSLYIAGRKTRRLVTEGPYSVSRNPLYFFSLVGFAGVGLASETVSVPLTLIIAFGLYYPTVIRAEERRLHALHAAEYEQYTNSTPRFFPAFGRLVEPETFAVNPRVFRRHVIHALVFVWAVGILELFEKLRDLGWIPQVWAIY